MFQGALSESVPSHPRVICLGETMVMFAPPRNELIETSSTFTSYLGGAEAQVAIGLERLGVHSAWIGKLTRNALGHKIVNEIRSQGVDTSSVVWTDSGRVGTFFFEFASHPRPMRTIYDRAESSATTLTTEEIDWPALARAEWIHLTGITPALSPTCLATVREVLRRCPEYNLKVCFDVNYRKLMWSTEDARNTLMPLLPFVDLLVGTQPDLQMLAPAPDPRAVLSQLVDDYGIRTTVMTLDAQGCLALDNGNYHQCPGHGATVVNRLGSGDAFVAGLLFGQLNGGLEEGLRYASAMAALKLTIPENTPLINRDDVEALLRGKQLGLLR
jgi:2-dehydro-3-deoxygluconokinase